MSEADKIIESLKKSGKKVEEFYISNKTSDKNVANIEDDIKTLIEENPSYKKEQAIEHILAELEQKDKRIKELEEERDHWHGCFIVAMENSIATQKVIDKIKELKNNIKNGNTRYPYIEEHKIEILEELLGGGK